MAMRLRTGRDDVLESLSEEAKESFLHIYSAVCSDLSVELATLLSRAWVKVDQPFTNGHTALIWAARLGKTEACEMLLTHGADADAQNVHGESALMAAAEAGHDTTVYLLVTCGKPGKSLEACKRPSLELRNEYGSTALAVAARCGQESAVRSLLEAGAEVNTVDGRGLTPVMWVCIKSHVALARLLLKKGGKSLIKDSVGTTALMHSARVGCDAAISTLIDHELTSFGGDSSDVLKSSQQARNLMESEDDAGNTALLWAARGGDTKCCEVLLEKGGDIDHQNHEGNTALMMAAQMNLPDVARLALARGANPSLTSAADMTAEVMAEEFGCIDVEELFRELRNQETPEPSLMIRAQKSLDLRATS